MAKGLKSVGQICLTLGYRSARFHSIAVPHIVQQKIVTAIPHVESHNLEAFCPVKFGIYFRLEGFELCSTLLVICRATRRQDCDDTMAIFKEMLCKSDGYRRSAICEKPDAQAIIGELRLP